MQFRLIYRGRLPAESRSETRAKDKHRIRTELHKQLAELWKTHPFLRNYLKHTVEGWRMKDVNSPTPPTFNDIFEPSQFGPPPIARMAERFAYQGYNFLPLVGEAFPHVKTACALDILFLRRDDPGGLVGSGGDIDNRIKVLFDALKMPKKGDGFNPGSGPAAGQDPFFCLLQDDSLISELRVATDRLLTPATDEERHTDVQLVIHCRTVLVQASAVPDGGASAAFAT